jgi:HEAT repeat protein
MPREQLQLLAHDVDRLLAAGAAVAAGDEKLRQRGQRLRELGQKVPVLAQIADAVDRTVNAPPKQVTPALLDLLLVVRQVRASLTAAGSDGAAEAIAPSGPWTTAAPTRELEGWLDSLTSSSPGRVRVLKKALERDDFTDLRMVGPLLKALGTTHHGLGRLLAQKALPAFGPAVLPELERGLDLKGKSDGARRLQALCVINPEKGAGLCRRALEEGSTPVKIQGLRSLSHIAPKETEKAALGLLEQKAGAQVHGAAYYALATAKSDAALDALVAGVLGARDENWHILQNASYSLKRLKHPQTTARLLEELAKAQEEVRTRQAASKKKAPAAKGSKAKSKAAQQKEAQKEARLLEEAVGRVRHLLELFGPREDNKAVPALVELLDHPHPDIRESAAQALIALNDPEGHRALADRLDDAKLTLLAARAAWRLPGKERFERLAPALVTLSQTSAAKRRPAESVLNQFATELSHIGGDPEMEFELEESGDEEYDEYDDAYGEDEDIWDDEEDTPRPPLTDWDPRWAPLLRKHLNGPARNAVAMALAVVLREKAVPELLKLLSAPTFKGGDGVIQALGALRAREAVPQLVEIFLKREYDYTTYHVLRQLGDPSAIPPLEAYLKKSKGAYKRNLVESLIQDLEQKAAKAGQK